MLTDATAGEELAQTADALFTRLPRVGAYAHVTHLGDAVALVLAARRQRSAGPGDHS